MRSFVAVLFCALGVVLGGVSAAHSERLAAALKSPDILFAETFDTDPFASFRWHKTQAAKYAGQPVLVKPPTQPAKGFEDDAGLMLSQEGKFYGVYSQLSTPVRFDGGSKNDFVVQYELKLEETISCSGAYLKLPRLTEGFDLTNMDNETPYTIMFGVDKCGGANNKVHVILQMQNPLTKEWEEKHATEVPTPKLDKKTHVYTLLLKRDNSYEVFVDKKAVKKGHLLTHMSPPVQPPREIPDPADIKPADWQDDEKIADPSDAKPADWDESAPRKIPDAKAKKPDGWDEHAPRTIPDPAASKPEDWIDEEDGAWTAPSVPNPACDNPGCGPWSAPTINNPAYKGKWSPRKIPNPLYKGPWVQKNTTNPHFYEVADPFAALPPVAAVAIEVLANNAGIIFDNIVLASTMDAAFAVADATFALKAEAEAKKERKEKKKATKSKIKEKKEKGDWRDYAEALLMQATQLLEDSPYAVWGTAGAALVALVLLVFPNANKLQLQSGSAANRAAAAPHAPSAAKAQSAITKKEVPEEQDEEEEDEGEEEEEVVEVKKSPSRRTARTK